jgi:hypothetical protein
MNQCEECGKRLGIFEGYRHPTMGTKYHLCSPCFDEVSESVTRWGEFVAANAMSIKTNNSTHLNWKELVPNLQQRRNIIDNVCAETDILMHK